MASSSSSSSSRVSEKYHVFLNFRGEDTRDNFTSHLYAALCLKKINTFIEDELPRGDEISQALLNAIEESMIAVIVFSEGYATSRWCLEELVKIIECKKSRDLMVIPVFYRVDPSHVRNQKGTFREAFVKHEERFEQSLEKVLRWKSALTEAAALSGFDSKNIRPEAALIEEIVKFILKILNHLSPIDNTGLVGIQSRIKEIESLLCVESEDVFRSVGLWGMGGVGKTTLARAVFTKLSSQFESVYFQSNVREESEKFGLVRLSRELLSAILEDQRAILESTFSKNRLHSIKVLIVFDDVTCSSQIEKLIGGLECFGFGSRIIITTRDKQVLKNCGVSCGNIYAVKGLVLNHALKLFSHHAFKLHYPPTGYMELSLRVVAFAEGVPLALKVLGASLFDKTNSEWENALCNLKRNPNPKIQDVSKISYDGLDDQEKNIFLNIACFFKHVPTEAAMEILDANGFDSEIGISNLIDKSLLTIDWLDTFDMHDLLQKMGHKIVKQEYKHPGNRSRLWHHDDIYHVLRGNTGTEAIEYISLDFSKIKEINLNRNAFLKMQSLRFLDFHSNKMSEDCGYPHSCVGRYYCSCFLDEGWCQYCLLDEEYKVNAPQGLKFDSTYLRYFRWFGYPLTSLPSNFDMENLVALIVPGSKIKQLWNGHLYLDKLRHLNLAHSKHLTRIPKLSMTPNLESLSLEGCTSLIEVPPSIQYLNKLVILNLKGCKSIVNLPTYIGSKFLQYLILSGCSSLEMAPKITCMERVYLDGTSITELPLIECPSRLEYLNLEDCSRLESLPSIICEIKSLGSLCISGCSKLHNLPEHFGKLESLFELRANNTFIRKLPCSISYLNKLRKFCLSGYRGDDLLVDSVWPFLSDLSSLEYLDLSDCQITRSPYSLGQLPSLRSLNLSRNNFEWIPSSIRQLSSLTSLDISYCERLKNLPKLPWNISVDAYNCVSLELCNSDSILWAKNINLGNCFKLDQNMLKSILEKKHYPIGGICFPGNEIPEWFIFQNVGFSVTLELPPLDVDKILESWFTVCLVVTFPELDKAPQSLAVRCKQIGIDEYGKRHEICVQEGTTEFQCNSLMSDHVILTNVFPMWRCWDETKWRYVILDFGGENCNVKKCGVKLRSHKDCDDEYVKQFSGYFSSDIEEEEEEEPVPKRLKF